MKKTFKIYGLEGHRQRESFNPSYSYDWSKDNNVRKLEVMNSDITGTNEYTLLTIERNTLEEIQKELYAQIDDGIFENSMVGKIEKI